MKFFLHFIFILFSLFSFHSCKIHNYAKEDKGKICELHHLTLHPTLVHITYGFFCSPKVHLGKGSENFPNARHQECGGCVVRPYKFVWIYSCSKCNWLKIRHKLSIKKEVRAERKVRALFD